MTSAMPETDNSKQQLFTDHLSELRDRLVIIVISVVVSMVCCGLFAQKAITFLQSASQVKGLMLVQLAPGEALMATIKMAVLLGLVVSSPVWLTQIIRFVLPGLTTIEKRALVGVTIGGLGLFAMGVWFSAVVILPAALGFLLGFAEPVAENQIAIGHFLDFCLAVLLLNGLLFELPLVIWALAGLGLITSSQILARWREGVVVVAVLSAVLTPSQDPASMLLVAGVLLVLLFTSLIPLRLLGK